MRFGINKIALALLAGLILSGCVERTITIKSDPPGAYVYLEGKEVGRTPVTVSFVHHGVREVSLYKRGYEKIKKYEEIKAPWFEWFPLDFFFEVLYPGKLKEEHVLSYKLQPAKEVDKKELLRRADELRQKAFHVLPREESSAKQPSKGRKEK